METNLLIVDANGVGYRANNLRALTDSKGNSTQAIFHSIKMMWTMCRRHKDFIPLMLWDSHTQWRYDLLPEYKGKRDVYEQQRKSREEYRSQRDDVMTAFDLMGLTSIKEDGYEADDIAALLARKVAKHPKSKALLYTNDHDWFQLVGDNVHALTIQGEKHVTFNNFSKVTGFADRGAFLQSKALVGDTSDNISGVGKIGDKTAAKLLDYFSSVKIMLIEHKKQNGFSKENLPPELSRDVSKLNYFCENKEPKLLFRRNLALMNLYSIDPPNKPFTRKRKAPDKEAFIDFCMSRDMITLAEKADLIFNDLRK